MRKFGEYLLARTGRAAGVAFLCALLPLIGFPGGFLASIIIGFVTLCRGPRSGLFVMAWVVLPALVLLYLHRFGLNDIILLRAVLVWLFAYTLRRLGSWTRVFEVGLVLGLMVVVAVHIAIPDLTTWWTTHLTKYLADINKATSMKLTAAQSAEFVKRVVPMATGIVAFIVLFGSWLVLLLARWWQTAIYYPGRLGDEFIGVRNTVLAAMVLVLGAVGVYLNQAIAIDLFPVLLFPFMMGGLSFMHYLSAAAKGFIVLVVLMYLGIFLLPFIVVVLLALIGFLDTCFNFRKFIKIKGDIS
ncbi:MAG: hypothetical protein KDH94_04770 [Coxiellaceae bacterium]|nr:hypothetical protein [Coxiellaceae bacterium]